MHDYKKLEVWKEAVELAGLVVKIAQKFPSEARYGLTSQISRSAISIASNIAEGAGRNTKGEFSNFLGIATGSSYELDTQLRIAFNIGYLSKEDLSLVEDKTDKVQKMIFRLKQSLNN